MAETAIRIENLKKQYRLGTIGGTTLNAELQSWWARKRGKEDPNLKLGQDYSRKNETFWALNGINLEVKKGEALGIIGANGAGKSTLLKILSRVTAPTEGTIKINGRISSMLEVGTGFHGELTGRENIYMNGAILGMSKKEVDRKINDIIEFSECEQFIDTPVKRYSSGMYVKLAFAVAANLDSEILVMDEVLAVGDMKFQKKCLGKMGDVAESEGRTVLYVSHNMATIRSLCTRCIVLEHGNKIYEGDTEEAIEVYMKNSKGELESKLDFLNTKKTSEVYRQKVFLTGFEFIDKDTPRYTTEEKMKFRIKWKGLKNVENIRIRMEIQYIDSSIVAMTESKPFADSIEGSERENIFEMKLANLAEGVYCLRLSIFTLNEMGVHSGLDATPLPIYFEVTDTVPDRTGWLRQYWGSVRFDDLVAVDSEGVKHG
ncbi:MAG: ABC transporter ATP-binding protein [Butyrivibrio sp.]|nr:ABC transporter ATP-binding protein [Butyrivibrio sp.]